MSKHIDKIFRLSDNMRMKINDTRRTVEIIHSVEGKMFSHTISGKDFTRFRNLVTDAGLHPAGIQSMLAIKNLVVNGEKWMPNSQDWKDNPELAQWLSDRNNELISAYNLLSEYITSKQQNNLDILSK